MLPHTPGMEAAASGTCSHLSGLSKDRVINNEDIHGMVGILLELQSIVAPD